MPSCARSDVPCPTTVACWWTTTASGWRPAASQRDDGHILLVAAAAGVSKLTLYSHFGSKQGLFVAAVRAKADVPLAVGFGIGTPQQASEVGEIAEGIIVGSALVDAVDRAPGNEVRAAVAFVQSLQEALQKERCAGQGPTNVGIAQ